MGLIDRFKPAHQSKDPEVRLRAVRQMGDENKLAEIAKHDSSPRVRRAAVGRISDQDLLVAVALDGKEMDARLDAVVRIRSQEKLAQIIKVRKNYHLMGACFAGITDPKILERIAHDPEYNMSARRMAIENYADESFLEELDRGHAEATGAKSPEEVAALVNKHGGVRLARAIAKFRGSMSAIMALGEIMRSADGDAAGVALEYLAQALAHANEGIARAAHRELATLKNARLISGLIGMIGEASLHDKILAVLRDIDHPDARQIVDSADRR